MPSVCCLCPGYDSKKHEMAKALVVSSTLASLRPLVASLRPLAASLSATTRQIDRSTTDMVRIISSDIAVVLRLGN